MKRHLLIATPGSRRCTTYCTEYLDFASVPAEVVSWQEIIAQDGNLDHLPQFDTPAAVRVESPGTTPEIVRLLLAAGERDSGATLTDWNQVEFPKGILRRPALLHRGFRRVMRGLARSFLARPHLETFANPNALVDLFDKSLIAERLVRAGIPTPARIKAAASVGLTVARILDSPWKTTYAKLNTGSSAVGIVVVVRDRPENEVVGTTTMTSIEGNWFHSRRSQELSMDKLIAPLSFLAEEGVIIQHGIRPMRVQERNCDFRVVCVDGSIVAVIPRLARGPITNLDLGGIRGSAECLEMVPRRARWEGLDLCEAAAQLAGSRVVGIDLIFEFGTYQPFLLELNAFGDFFPRWQDAKGRSLHRSLMERFFS